MNRREMLKGTVGGMMLAAAGNSVFAADHAGHSAAHQHMGMSMNQYQSLIGAAADCVKKGHACLSHGIHLWSEGENKGMAICAMRVNEMIAACEAIEQLASYNSAHLVKMAKVVMDICQDCEKECRKFEKEHVQCREAADSCDACFKECKKITG
ncbi:MAG: four-helix bundle copper-binding protein [Nitrosomonadales bacterium]|nr:four-helix bundle copper-binding protein [Nitrosomonadales bacterium]